MTRQDAEEIARRLVCVCELFECERCHKRATVYPVATALLECYVWGVEDSAKVAEKVYVDVSAPTRTKQEAIAFYIRSLIPAPTATAQDKKDSK